MDEIAEQYVKMVLELGLYDPNYVDFYIGPDEWRPEDETRETDFPYLRFKENADRLLGDLEKLKDDIDNSEEKQRYKYLQKQLRAAATNVELLAGKEIAFDDQSKLVYDAINPEYPDGFFDETYEDLNRILPGSGPLNARFESFVDAYRIPADKTQVLFDTAMEEVRIRTQNHLNLPDKERVTIETVSGKIWGGYSWYQGNNHSVVQLNIDKPRLISAVTHLAAHEGYPGHHFFHLILDNILLKKKGWIEYCVYPLFSAQSLISEGTAEYALKLAFPGNEKTEFEEKVIFPMAGLDPSAAGLCNRVFNAIFMLRQARIDIARKYLNRQISRDQALDQLIKYQVLSRSDAERTLKFIETGRAYVITYALGYKLVNKYMDAFEDNSQKWEQFQKILSTPFTPSDFLLNRS